MHKILKTYIRWRFKAVSDKSEKRNMQFYQRGILHPLTPLPLKVLAYRPCIVIFRL